MASSQKRTVNRQQGPQIIRGRHHSGQRSVELVRKSCIRRLCFRSGLPTVHPGRSELFLAAYICTTSIIYLPGHDMHTGCRRSHDTINPQRAYFCSFELLRHLAIMRDLLNKPNAARSFSSMLPIFFSNLQERDHRITGSIFRLSNLKR